MPEQPTNAYIFRNAEIGRSDTPQVGKPPANAGANAGAGAAYPVRVAVKDIIDVKGMPTTAGTAARLREEPVAAVDAACLKVLREPMERGEIVITGKTNTHELALGVTGINPWYGTPVNPINPAWIPGGSSSGSAVAVAGGDATFALGSDTGGSIRIPAACCGVVGLKTTFGKISTQGCVALAPSLDTIGPMAVDVDGIVRAMGLLVPGFSGEWEKAVAAKSIGYLDVGAEPGIDAAVQRALHLTGIAVRTVSLPMWDEAAFACGMILVAEAWSQHGHLVDESPELLGEDVKQRLSLGRHVGPDAMSDYEKLKRRWSDQLGEAFGKVDAIALPTLSGYPPVLSKADDMFAIRNTLPVNLAGIPAIAIPATNPADGSSVQLIGPAGSEAMLVATAATIELGLIR